MDGNEWMEVSSDGIPLCWIKYNGQFLSNADQNLSDEYLSKIADIQEKISTVRARHIILRVVVEHGDDGAVRPSLHAQYAP